MAVKRVHVVGNGTAVTTELIAPGESRRVNSILITNAESGPNEVTVSLFLETPSGTGKDYDRFYIIRNVGRPSGASLLLDDAAILSFKNTLGLYASCSDGNELDITIT